MIFSQRDRNTPSYSSGLTNNPLQTLDLTSRLYLCIVFPSAMFRTLLIAPMKVPYLQIKRYPRRNHLSHGYRNQQTVCYGIATLPADPRDLRMRPAAIRRPARAEVGSGTAENSKLLPLKVNCPVEEVKLPVMSLPELLYTSNVSKRPVMMAFVKPFALEDIRPVLSLSPECILKVIRSA